MVAMQAMMMPCCSTEMVVTPEISAVISAERLAMAESSRLAEAREVSLNKLLTSSAESSLRLEQSESHTAMEIYPAFYHLYRCLKRTFP